MRSFFYSLLCLFSFLNSQPVTAQTINPELIKITWPARWISHPTASRKDYGVFHFRRSFNLTAKPGKFIVHVSGDNRYRFFVNGKSVCEGPARGDVNHWRFETVDIAPHLQAGENTLAAVVWNQGLEVPLAQMTYQTGFLVQGDTPAEEMINTGANWRVLQNHAYKPIIYKPVDKRLLWKYYVAGALDSLTAELYPWGWEQPNYNDSQWLKPLVIFAAKSDLQAGDLHWNLVPRNIPPMENKLQRFAAVRRSRNVMVPPGFLKGKQPFNIPANTNVTILLDNQVLTTAYPELQVSGGKGSTIQITYSEALWTQDGKKVNRNQVEGLQMIGFHDSFLPDGRPNLVFRPLWWRTFRYVQLDIKTGAEPLVLHDLKSWFTAYPFEENGRFSANDPVLKNIWNVSWRTARLCANETYMDCPYYEQLQYIGDTRIQSLISLYVSGDDRLMRNAIAQFDQSRIPEGITQSRYPSELMQITPTYSLSWVMMVHDYFRHRPDEAFVKQFLPGIRNVLEWFENRRNHQGLIGGLPYYDFFDTRYPLHVISERNPEKSMTVSSLYFADALDKAAELFRFFGKTAEGEAYQKLADTLKAKVNEHCFNAGKGYYSDAPDKKYYSQHANVMAILTNTLPEARQGDLLEKTLADTSLIQATTYFQFYHGLALQKTGLGHLYLNQLQPWKNMLAQGLTTFAEQEVQPRSDCHAWSASPNYFFLSLVCGLQPGSRGFSTVHIAPNLGQLKQVTGQMPHPAGIIQVNYDYLKNGKLKAVIQLPGNLTGTYTWKGETTALHPGRQEIIR